MRLDRCRVYPGSRPRKSRLPAVALWNQPEALCSAAVPATLETPLAYEAKDLRRLARLLDEFPVNEIAHKLKGDGPSCRLP
jgi:hypothetical protein